MTAERTAAPAAAKALPPKPNTKSGGTDFDSSLLIIRVLLPSFEISSISTLHVAAAFIHEGKLYIVKIGEILIL